MSCGVGEGKALGCGGRKVRGIERGKKAEGKISG